MPSPPSSWVAFLVVAVLAGAAGAAIALLAARARARGAALDLAQARRRAAGLETFLAGARTTPLGTHVVPIVPRAGVSERIENLERRRGEALTRLLADVRDASGADEAVYWRRVHGGAALVPVAWSGGGAVPARLHEAEWRPLVAWAAEQRLVSFDAPDGDAPRLGAGPAGDDPLVCGAVSVSSPQGLRASRDRLRHWLPRHGAQVEQLAGLLEMREAFTRQGQHTRALLEASQLFQSNRSTDTLAESICETARSMTGGQRAALVRWHAGAGRGEVQYVSRGHPLAARLAVTDESHVGRMCRDGLPQVWEDARFLDRGAPVYSRDESPRAIGSLGIVPLKRGLEVTGALVIEGDAPRDVLIRDIRTVRVLAALAAVSLETVWEIEEVTRHARTDPLTGLANRRCFDDQLARLLAETDRFGGAMSLVMVDIDHFKTVNDTYGHDAGDLVLQAVARALQEGVRTVDVCARFGGEELAILLPQTPLAGAIELADRLRLAVERRTLAHAGGSIAVTASFGVASYPESVTTRDGLFAATDRALYRAKREGRNRVRSAPPLSSPRAGQQ